jgi:hypothetical protein
MSTPHCPVCGRWDGSHSGGCPNTGKPYPTSPRCPLCGRPSYDVCAICKVSRPEWVRRAFTSTLPAKVLA